MTELYKDFHIALSDFRAEWKRAKFCLANNLESTEPSQALRNFAMAEKLRFLSNRCRVAVQEP